MKKNHVIMLTIIAASLICSNLIQLSGWRPSPIFWRYTAWLAIDAIAIWAIVAIGRIKPHQPEHSPLEYGGIFLFLVGAMAFYGISTTVITNLITLINPAMMPELEHAGQLHDWSPQKSMIGNLWPIVAAPVLEEIIFRVGILGGLMLIIRKPWAIVFSAGIFALNHADIYPPPTVAITFIFGLIAAATYLILGLRAAIIVHMLSNSHELWRPFIIQHEYLMMGYIVLMFTALFIFIHQLIRHRRLVLR
ncbi:MAG TPA: CPBP family intramembrane glutamic endopeptidase [Oligoflexus sp.]|uniref:CPBP family intramembrane glutamic endopeptidase n=1 Tax=Oligoflexus sp. TaxID=1971216 RepID=UPI002D66D357|nr:CPBP family intramembrane glutamic endopeptidase [Oligoflexus sp.]HYX37239.1 CPBP family intramembrane glutamic endopeptidase [Oligoflexus sp.]